MEGWIVIKFVLALLIIAGVSWVSIAVYQYSAECFFNRFSRKIDSFPIKLSSALFAIFMFLGLGYGDEVGWIIIFPLFALTVLFIYNIIRYGILWGIGRTLHNIVAGLLALLIVIYIIKLFDSLFGEEKK